MDDQQLEVNDSNVTQLAEKQKAMRRKVRSDAAVAEGRLVVTWIDGDGTPITRIRLGGAGADLFRRLMAANDRGVSPSQVTLFALDQLKWAGVMVRQQCGLFGFLTLKFPAERYVLEEGTLAA